MTIPESFYSNNAKKYRGRQRLLLIHRNERKTMTIGRWLWYHVRNTEWILLYFSNNKIYTSVYKRQSVCCTSKQSGPKVHNLLHVNKHNIYIPRLLILRRSLLQIDQKWGWCMCLELQKQSMGYCSTNERIYPMLYINDILFSYCTTGLAHMENYKL